MRPPNPKDLGFTINHEYLEAQDFIVGDIRVDSARHILLATPKQREILRTTRRWFMDGTFKVIDVPFQGGQLMSIHGFVQSDGVMKQLPLMFVVMSRRRKDDYVAVLRQVKDILGDVSVQGFVLDFEAAAWGAIRDVFPGLQIKGCTFHWAQSVWRHVQSIGLGPAYMERKSVWDWIRKLLVLPFLPSNHIATTFNSLAARATNDQQKELVHYIRQQWIESELFPIESWCVFRYRIRTNNDVEGWHNRLNSDCGYRSLSFYRMVPALRKQALDTEIDIDELLDHGVGRQQRRQTRHCEKEISELWDQYEKKGTECHQIPSRNQPCLWTSRVYG
ncbi:uncharacterized protein LOC123540737 [Mercenaria mercenaria]|uniref:uncharacterized protein LOC123540737 n=1 Tax=Mercenaria mercenaria TaxID=6596 RepID=UPI001E1DF378|nr:uncharacterized protein LOC123540737 [Mercenaria mercenaria]